MSFPTTRIYPRTTQEAFKDASYGEWFYPPEPKSKALLYIGLYLWAMIAIYFLVTA